MAFFHPITLRKNNIVTKELPIVAIVGTLRVGDVRTVVKSPGLTTHYSALSRLVAMRFVILRHRLPAHSDRVDHFDWMFESEDGQLETWATVKLPGKDRPVEAEPLAPHRRDYLDYEGPVSGDRGDVQRLEQGTYSVVQSTESQRTFRLQGQRLAATIQIAQNPSGDWWLSFKKSKNDDDLPVFPDT